MKNNNTKAHRKRQSTDASAEARYWMYLTKT